MDPSIVKILENFVIAVVILYLTDRERKTLLERLAKLEDKHEKLTNQYQDDLRDWSGIDPKFNTWSNRQPLDSDTKIRQYVLTTEERSKAEELMNR